MTEFNWNSFINELKKFQKGIGINPNCENTKLWKDFIFNYRRK